MVRRPDRPRRIVRVSFETTRFSPKHLIDAYAGLVPTVKRMRLPARPFPVDLRQERATQLKSRRGER